MYEAEGMSDFICSAMELATKGDLGSVTPKTCLQDLNLDSLTFVSVLAQAEAVYNLSLSEDEIDSLLMADSLEGIITILEAVVRRSRCAARI